MSQLKQGKLKNINLLLLFNINFLLIKESLSDISDSSNSNNHSNIQFSSNNSVNFFSFFKIIFS